MVNLFRFLRGYVKIEITSDQPEIFLNFCRRENISVWSIKSTAEATTLCISVSDFRSIREKRSKTGASFSIKIRRKYGASFMLSGIRKRPSILAGLAVFVLVSLFLSLFIWEIDVVGQSAANRKEIEGLLRKFNVNTGIMSSNVDAIYLAQNVVLAAENVAWASVNIEGSKLTVNFTVAENEKVDTSSPRNIVASADGVIRRSEVEIGSNLARPGKAVKKGDILVSGIVENSEKTHFVRSKGTIIAESTRRFTYKIDKQMTLSERTMNHLSLKHFDFFGIKIPLFLKDISPDVEFVGEFKQNLRMMQKDMPILLVERDYVLLSSLGITCNKSTAANIALGKTYEAVRLLPIEYVLDFCVTVTEEKDHYSVAVDIKCLENICAYSEIEVGND